MAVHAPSVAAQPLSSKLTKNKLQRGTSDASTMTMTSANSYHDDLDNAKASMDKVVSFAPSPTSVVPASPGERSQIDAELVHDKKDKAKRPSFKRNLSSLWKVLDPPSDANNSGVLHNLCTKQEDNHRRKKSADDVTLLQTTADRKYKQR